MLMKCRNHKSTDEPTKWCPCVKSDKQRTCDYVSGNTKLKKDCQLERRWAMDKCISVVDAKKFPFGKCSNISNILEK